MQTLFSLFTEDGYIGLIVVTSIGLLFELLIQLKKKASPGIPIGLILIIFSGAFFILHRITLSNEALIGTYLASILGVGLIIYSGYQDAKRTGDMRALVIKRIVIGWIIVLAVCAITLVAVFVAKKLGE